MPIGKNSIKRVANNGYSAVKTAAPDMENSTVLANPSPEVISVMIPSSEKIAPKTAKTKSATEKKPTAKKTSAAAKTEKPTAKKASAAPKTEKGAVEKEEGNVAYVNLGREMPTYLL